MLESKRLPREMSLAKEKKSERGGNNTLIVKLANGWGPWEEVYSYIRPQKVLVVLEPIPADMAAITWGEMRFIDTRGDVQVIKVPSQKTFWLELGRSSGAARKRVFARFSSSLIPIFRTTGVGIRERVIISKVSNL